MEVKAKLTNKANAIASAKVDANMLDNQVENMAKKASKNIKIAGFRPGKVPVSVVKKRYLNELQKDAEQEILREVLAKAIENTGKKEQDMMGEPFITKFDKKDDGIDIEIEISFRPEVKVENIDDIIPEYSTPRVTKKEIETKKEELVKLFAPIEKSDKTTLESGDYAKFDFEGSVDGVKFDGGSAKDYILEIGSNQFIPGFENQMIGMKVGEEKDLNVKFPNEYGAKDLAGKDAVFKVKLNEIQSKKIPQTLDEEMLKKLVPGEENPTEEKLEERLKDQIRDEKLSKLINEDLKPKLVDALIEKFKFDLPKNLVEQEIDMRFRNEWQKFSPEEMKEFRENKDALTKKREEQRAEAEKSVALTFIIDELAKARNISVNDQELLQAIYFEAYRYGIDPKKHLETYKNQGALPIIKMAMIEEKLFNSIFSKDNKKSKEKEEK